MNKRLKKALFHLRYSLTNKYLFGENTSVNVRNAMLKYTSMNIKKGKDNSVLIGNNSRIDHCSIFVNGSNNKIYIGEECTLKGVSLWIEEDNNEIVIGKGTTIECDTQVAAIEGTTVILARIV